MTHPEQLLAGYVDGTLTEPERADVDAHLATCAVCREEVKLARAAVEALLVLEEEPVPLGVTGPVLAEADRRFEGRRARAWGRLQWAAGLAAAAALVAVVALNVGGGRDADTLRAIDEGAGEAVEAPAEAGAAPAPAIAGLERLADETFDEAGIRALARAAALQARSTEAPGAEDATRQLAAPDAALSCLRTAGAPIDEPADRIVRLIEARYLNTPAYLAVLLESPGPDRPPTHAVVWVVAIDDCRILVTAQQRI